MMTNIRMDILAEKSRLPAVGRRAVVLTRLIGVAVLFATAGCGNDGPMRVPVRGAVWVDGKPLKKGSIHFIPTDGTKGPEAAGVIKDGFYEITEEKGPVVGTMRVEIYDAVDPGFDMDDPMQFGKHAKKPLPKGKIPAKYNKKSTLKRTLTEDLNKLDFKIETQKKRRSRR
ncbi:MAG: hypothetical protein ACE5KM_12620 [Planctomycetaceae bacterium]